MRLLFSKQIAATAIGVSLILTAAPAVATTHLLDNVAAATQHHHACTRTSSGSCIRGGEFCPVADYGHKGYDAKGRKYICKGSHSHPHWELP